MSPPGCTMIVDDSDVDRRLAVRVIRKLWPGTVLLEASDGEEAIGTLRRCGDAAPDLILLDVNMPKMNGHRFLEAWYADSGLDVPVVVMLTSSSQSIDRELAARFPCVRHYIVKPITTVAAARLPDLIG